MFGALLTVRFLFYLSFSHAYNFFLFLAYCLKLKHMYAVRYNGTLDVRVCARFVLFFSLAFLSHKTYVRIYPFLYTAAHWTIYIIYMGGVNQIIPLHTYVYTRTHTHNRLHAMHSAATYTRTHTDRRCCRCYSYTPERVQEKDKRLNTALLTLSLRYTRKIAARTDSHIDSAPFMCECISRTNDFLCFSSSGKNIWK